MKKKIKIYIDTSVFGGCFDEEFEIPSKNIFRQIRKGKYIGVVSDLTIQELEKAPKKVFNLFSQMPSNNKIVLKINDESIQLANSYITEDILTPKFFNDAIHIDLATISKVDVLISWNFKHIVNYHKILLFNSVNLKKLYSKIEIRSPLELLNE
jgi:predicted nucleic acid-binding protein